MTNYKRSVRTLIKRTLLLLFLGLVISCVLGVLIYRNMVTGQLDNFAFAQQRQIAQAQVFFSQRVGDIKHTVELLRNSPQFAQSLSHGQPIDNPSMNQLFSSFVRSVDSLMQVRWLDENGQEQARVDGVNGQAIVTQENKLQNKSERYYFQQGMQTPLGSVYLSQLDLNMENGEIQQPYRPTIRAAVTTGYSNYQPKGLLILNYDVGSLLSSVRMFNNERVNMQIVDAKGYWVMNHDSDLEWGDDLKQPENNISQVSPQLWHLINQRKEAQGVSLPLGLFSYHCAGLVSSYQQERTVDGPTLCFISVTPRAIIDDIHRDALTTSSSVSFAIFLIGLIVVVRDYKANMSLIHLNQQLVHEKKLLEESSNHTQHLLEQQQLLQDDLVESRKLSALGMMVAGVAHELNTPIGTAIMASSKLRADNRDLAESVKTGLTKSAMNHYLQGSEKGLDLIEASQRRAAELITSFKRLAIDRASEEIVQFNLNQVISDLVKTFQHRLKSSNVTIETEIGDITMIGTPGVVSHVVQNLIVNAIQHAFDSETGGVITISATLTNPNRVELTIADNGKGISPDILPKLFDPFVTSNRSHGNTGLGMHFVYQWVTESLGGTITVQSEVSEGTRFIITMPQHHEEYDSRL